MLNLLKNIKPIRSERVYNMLYRIDTRLSNKDYLDFNLFVNFCTPYGKKQFAKLRVLFAAIPLFVWFLGVVTSRFENFAWFSLVVEIVLSVILFFAVKPFVRFVTKCNCKKMMKKAKVPFTPEATMEFYNDYFVEESPESRAEIKYSSITQVYLVNSEMIYLFNSAVSAYLIPVSSFSGEDEFKSFMDFIAEKTHPVITEKFS